MSESAFMVRESVVVQLILTVSAIYTFPLPPVPVVSIVKGPTF